MFPHDTDGTLTNITAALAVVSPWLTTANTLGQLLLTALGIAWLALQIYFKLLERKKP